MNTFIGNKIQQLNKKITPETKEELTKKIQEDFEQHFRKTLACKNNIDNFKYILKKRFEEYFISNNMSIDVPFYKHNCLKCTYLGNYIKTTLDNEHGMLSVGYLDLYAHMREDAVELIARYGDNIDDYYSYTYFIAGKWEEQRAIMQSIDGIYEAFVRYGNKCRPNLPKDFPFLYDADF